MTLTIGRVGFDVTLNGPSSLSFRSGVLGVEGPIRVGSVADLKTMRKQILGLLDNPWEPVVPVSFSTDADIGGWYEVLDIGVEVPTFGYKNGYGAFSASLRPVPAFANPVAEHITSGADRSGTPGGTSTDHWWAFPSTYTFLGGSEIIGSALATPRVGPGGTAYFVGPDPDYIDAVVKTLPSLSGYYTMGAKITDGNGNVVTGAHLPTTSSVTISNGLIELAGLTAVRVPVAASPGTWSSAHTVAFGYGASPLAGFSGVPVVLRNCPEEVVVRYAGNISPSGVYYPVNLDIALRRGARVFTCVFSSAFAGASFAAGGSGVQFNASSSAVTRGLRQTSNDADGNRFVAVSGISSYATTLGNGILKDADDFFPFMFGWEIGGATAPTPDTVLELTQQYFAAMTETQTIVSP